MLKRKADLHIHTTMSDGTDTVEEIMSLARHRGIDTIAITDHDTTAALENLERPDDMTVIDGIELSTWHEGTSVHVLGYFIDINNKVLKSTLSNLKNERRERGVKILEKLDQIEGIHIDPDTILKKSTQASIGRMDIARELVRMGIIKKPGQAFERFIGDGMPCYVSTRKISTAEAVRLIEGANGIPVLAHPGTIDGFTDYEALLDLGFKGIEVFYPKHTREQRQFFHDLAVKRNILVAGGSDFHGSRTPGRNKIGQAYLSENYMTRIFEYINERK